MRKETAAERKAWTEHVDGAPIAKPNKYGAERSGKYASKHEEAEAAKLWALQRAGNIHSLQEQVPFVLVPGNGRIRSIKYVADFVYVDDNGLRKVADAKGYSKVPVYRLKKKLMLLIHGIEIEEL